MKILLIMPLTETKLTFAAPDRYKRLDIGNYPPLGLMYIASYLKKFSHHEVKIVDMMTEGLNFDRLLNKIKEYSPQVVGFYSNSFTINTVKSLSDYVKRLNKEIIIIIGGPHVDIYPYETAALDNIDYVVLGEGEITVFELLNSLEKNKDPIDVKGLVYKRNSKIYFTGQRPLIENLDTLPLPDRRLTNYKKYYSVIGKNKIATTIMTSRGCPYRCHFCFIQYGGRYRARSAKNVVEEIIECVNLGITEFFFFDEVFTIDKRRVIAICDEIIKHHLNINFAIRARVDDVDEEMLAKLKQAGCMRIQYGVESGSDEILKLMNKGITVEQAREAVKLTKKFGIDVYLDFMIGYPKETKEQIMKTINFAKELDPDYVQFAITTLYPATKIYEDALNSKLLDTDFWKNVATNPPEKILPPLASDRFTRSELEDMLCYAYSRFYLRPQYMLKRLTKIKTFSEFFRQLKAGYQLLIGK